MGPPGTFCFVWLSLHQHYTYIIYIGAGGAGDQQPVHCLQGVVGVVICQHGGHSQAVGGQGGIRIAVRVAARRIGGAVGAVTLQNELQPWSC